MGQERRFAPAIFAGSLLGLLLASCEPPPPAALPPPPTPLAGPPAPPNSPPPAAATMSSWPRDAAPRQPLLSEARPNYPRFGDSDDYLCNQGAPDDPRTAPACARLRGADAPPVSRGTSRFGDSDDYVCNSGPPGDPRTVEACQRLRGPTP